MGGFCCGFDSGQNNYMLLYCLPLKASYRVRFTIVIGLAIISLLR
jgi:hypothetical protein